MKNENYLQAISRLGFLSMAYVFVLVSLFFLFNGSLSFTSTIVIFTASLLLSNLTVGLKKQNIFTTFIVLVSIIILIIFSKLYIDLTFDGQAYHQEMMIQMSNGWNPLYNDISEANNQSIWVNHYSKAYEIIGAIFYKITNTITAVKFINFFFLILSFLYPFIYFKRKKSLKASFFIAAIIAFNPVTITQLMTNLIDGFLYAISVVMVFSYLLSKTEKKYILDFIFATLILINVKFTGVVFAVAIVGVIFLYRVFVEKQKTMGEIKKLLILTLITIPFLFSPYIKNTYQKGHPFYPLMGQNNIDFVEDYVPDVIKDNSKISKLVLTSFVSIGNRSDSNIKIPFTFTFNELQKLRNGAPRVGSFGVWWGGILLISFIYYFISVFQLRKQFTFSIYEFIVLIILTLLVINKAGWWLRYTPYFWLTPLLLYLSINRFKNQSKPLLVLFLLVTINGLLALTVSLGLRYKDSLKVKEQLIELANNAEKIKVDFGAYLGNKALFKEYNIDFIEQKASTFNNSITFNNQLIIERKNP